LFFKQATRVYLESAHPPGKQKAAVDKPQRACSLLSMFISYKISFPYQLESRPSEISLGGPAEPILAEPYEFWRAGTIAKLQ